MEREEEEKMVLTERDEGREREVEEKMVVTERNGEWGGRETNEYLTTSPNCI